MTRADVYIRWEPGCEPPESLAGYLSGLSLAQWSYIMGAAPEAYENCFPAPRPPELKVWWDRINQIAASGTK